MYFNILAEIFLQSWDILDERHATKPFSRHVSHDCGVKSHIYGYLGLPTALQYMQSAERVVAARVRSRICGSCTQQLIGRIKRLHTTGYIIYPCSVASALD